ncbi:unnamed protein product [Chironomus riparius]|uniref:Uncharacterized protein n=1 Tax=Chironomus riparius TaxID=315576 RepID=A0A9N9RJX2_9DIPT|nr:unnamed protein product [Chironomus riparius]
MYIIYQNTMDATLEKPQNQWNTFNLTESADLFKLLKELNAMNHQSSSGNILKLKFIVGTNFEELGLKYLKTLEQKFKFKSIVILIAANDGKEFHIYWKSKDIDKFLILKSFNQNDQILYEYVAEFLSKSLNDGHLGTHINFDIISNNYEPELHHIMDSRNYNLLFVASEAGHAKSIDALLKYGLQSQMPEKKLTAQSLALNGGFSDVLLKQLQGNLPFPPFIEIENCSEDLKRFINMCEEVHSIIKSKNLIKLNEILSQNPNIRYFYNQQNESALKSAVTSRAFRIYKFLIERNYNFAPHEDIDEILKPLNLTDKEDLNKIHIQCCKDLPEKHINILIHNTTVTHDDKNENERLELVRKAYRTLNKDPRLRIILQIVAAVKLFHIVFDFCRDSTFGIDPTTNTSTTGIFYYSGRILIAAKQLLNPKTENETYGALAHELCHFAVHEVFENKANPCRKLDYEAKMKFKKILDVCKQNKDKDKIINNVFMSYGINAQPSELVVRPAHLIALYHDQPLVLQQKVKLYPELFEFYEEVIIPEMKTALPKIDAKIAYLPAYTFSVLSDQKQSEVKNAIVVFKNVKVKLGQLFHANSSVFEKLTSNHISQLLSKKIPNFNDPQLRYLEYQINFKWQSLADNLKDKIFNSKLNFQGQVMKFKDLYRLYPLTFHALTHNQIISILSDDQIKIGDEVKSDIDFYIERKFIPEDSKLIDFEYQYGSKYVDNYETREQHKKQRKENKTLETFYREFIKEENSNILDEAKENSHFKTCYFDLCQKGYSFMHKSSTELINQAKNDKILILSSEAGAGKTVTFEQLAIKNKKVSPTQWVSYIDLNSYTDLYKVEGSSINVQVLLEKILSRDSTKNSFEVEIFRESYKSGNLVLVWNGFDEISPTYNNFIINIIKYIRNNTSNIQFVCTRPLYSAQLSKAFKVRAWQLLPFDEEKKQEFLKEYFAFQKVPADKIETYLENFDKIVRKLNYEKLSFAYDFNSPLMLKLLAAIHKNEKLFENSHIYGIFDDFIDAKIRLWLEKDKNNYEHASKLLYKCSLRPFFQKYALLNELQIFSSTTLVLKLRKLQIMQKDFSKDVPIEVICRMGILYINGKNEFQFTHKTLSEFFVAQYFIENIYNVDYVSSDEAELRLELFYHLTHTYGNLQQIITDFMRSFLQIESLNVNKSFNLTISSLLKSKFNNFFIRMLDTNHPQVFEFLIEFFKKDHDLLIDLLHVHKDETFYTAIFNPNYFALSTNPEKISLIARKHLNSNEFEKFINGRNQKGKILFGMHFFKLIGITKSHDSLNFEVMSLKDASYWKFFKKYCGPENQGLFKKLMGKTKGKKLKDNEQHQVLMTALSPKIYLFYNKMFRSSDFDEYKKLWENYENLIPLDQMQNFLGDILVHYFEICGYEVNGHENFLSLLLEKVEKFLTNSEIYEMFLTKSILHGAHWDHICFTKLWDFLKSHTNKYERKMILSKNEVGERHFYFYTSRDDMKDKYSNNQYSYSYYDFTPFKLFHKSIITNFELIKEIYENHFTKIETQNMILKSNEFLYYAIRTANKRPCEKLVAYLQNLFVGNENALKEFLNRKVYPTDLSIYEFIEVFRGLPHSQAKWFDNLAAFDNINIE